MRFPGREGLMHGDRGQGEGLFVLGMTGIGILSATLVLGLANGMSDPAAKREGLPTVEARLYSDYMEYDFGSQQCLRGTVYDPRAHRGSDPAAAAEHQPVLGYDPTTDVLTITPGAAEKGAALHLTGSRQYERPLLPLGPADVAILERPDPDSDKSCDFKRVAQQGWLKKLFS